MKEINRILDDIPIENRRNIDFLFKFLAKLNEDEAANKMTISNLIIVIGPNLLWERDTKAPVRLEHVCRSLIQQWREAADNIFGAIGATAVGEQDSSDEDEPFDTCDELDEDIEGQEEEDEDEEEYDEF